MGTSDIQRARELVLQISQLTVELANVLGEPSKAAASHVVRYPCSATCTHDDAANPGHPERVREQSAALTAAMLHPHGACTCGGEGFCEWCGREKLFEAGAEAMRAACLEAIQGEKDEIGLTAYQRDRLKVAIEGADPTAP